MRRLAPSFLQLVAAALAVAVVLLLVIVAERLRPAGGSASPSAGRTGSTVPVAAGVAPDPTPTDPAKRTSPTAIRPTKRSVQAAVDYAARNGYDAGVAVIDTTTGVELSATTGGDDTFSTESVAKLFIAARLRTDGPWDENAETAWTMITQSDDDSANALYGLVGGDDVMQWVTKVALLRRLNASTVPIRNR